MSDNEHINKLVAESKRLQKQSDTLVKQAKQLSKNSTAELTRQAALQALDLIERSEQILREIQELKK
jgi:hypothetical protein